MADRNPCFRCGFNDEDFGCTADPFQPWTVPEDCYLYDEQEVARMIDFYKNKKEENNG